MSSRRPYVRKISTTTWYFKKKRDLVHMMQELTSLFVGIYGIVLLWGVKALAEGPQAYGAFLEALTSPLSLAFHWVAFPVVTYHAISWFNVTHKAMPVQIGEEFLPGKYIVGAHYAAWIGFSLIVLIVAGVF